MNSPSQQELIHKQGTIIEDESYRTKVEFARTQLESSRSILRPPRLPQNTNQHVTFASANKGRQSYKLPLVYFVVKSDKLPSLADNLPDSKSLLKSHAKRVGRTVVESLQERKRQHDEDVKRVKALGSRIGLKVEPIKMPIPDRQLCSSKEPTTPFNTMSELSGPEELDHRDIETDDLTTGGPPTDPDIVDVASVDKQPTKLNIELPGINRLGSDARSTTPDSCASKRVHFANNSSPLKACDIHLPKVEQLSDESSASFTPQVNNREQTNVKTESESLFQSNTPRSKSRRFVNPLKLPKIDLLTPIYDELILKTFQDFIKTNNPMSERNVQAILQRVSAILHPVDERSRMHDRKASTSSRPYTRETSFFSTELSGDYTDETSNNMAIDGKSMSVLMRGMTTSKMKREQVHSTCFEMCPPGLTKEKSEVILSTSRKRHDIYIPSSC